MDSRMLQTERDITNVPFDSLTWQTGHSGITFTAVRREYQLTLQIYHEFTGICKTT